MWYRVFAGNLVEPLPSEIVDYLHTQSIMAEGHFRGDDLGWTSCDLRLGVGSPVLMERYLTKEDDIRDDLNSWAAWLETANYSPNSGMLMERVIQSHQLFTLRKPVDHADEVQLEKMLIEVCQFLAKRTSGFYQIDGQGFFAADGTLLVAEY